MVDEIKPVEGALRSEEDFAKDEDLAGVEERTADGLAEKEAAANPEDPAAAKAKAESPKKAKPSKATKAKKSEAKEAADESEAKEADSFEADSFEASH